MAELKRRTFILSTGKQIKLFGSSMAIGKSLESVPDQSNDIQQVKKEVASMDCPLTVRYSADTTAPQQHNITQQPSVGQSFADF